MERKRARKEQRRALGLPKGPKKMPSQKTIQAKVFAMQKVPSLLLDQITHFMHIRGFTKVGKRIKIERQSRNRINGKQDHIGSFTYKIVPPLEEIWNEWLNKWLAENPDKAKPLRMDQDPEGKLENRKNRPQVSDSPDSSDEDDSSSSEDEEEQRQQRPPKRAKVEIDGEQMYVPIEIGDMPKQSKIRRGKVIDAQTGLINEEDDPLRSATAHTSVPEPLVNGNGQRVKPPLTTRKSEDANGTVNGKLASDSDISSSEDDSSSDSDAEEDAVDEDASAVNGGVSTKSKDSIMKDAPVPVSVSETLPLHSTSGRKAKVEKEVKKQKKPQRDATSSSSSLSSDSDADSESSDSETSGTKPRGPRPPPIPKNMNKSKRKKLEMQRLKILEAPDLVTGEIIKPSKPKPKPTPKPAAEKASKGEKVEKRKRSLSPFSARALISPHPALPPTPMVPFSHNNPSEAPTYISLMHEASPSSTDDEEQTGIPNPLKPKGSGPKLPAWKQALRAERKEKKDAKRAKKGLGRKLKPFEIQRLKRAELDAIAKGEDPTPYQIPNGLHVQYRGPKQDWSAEKEKAIKAAKEAQELHWKMYGPGATAGVDGTGDTQMNGAVNGNGSGSSTGQNRPFERVAKDTPMDPRFASNAYLERKIATTDPSNVNGFPGNANAAGREEYGSKAHRDLIVTRGKGFTKEKNKKKRGSYRGGAIDVAGGGGVKFD